MRTSLAGVLLGALALTACTAGDGSSAGPEPSPEPPASTTPTEPASSAATESSTAPTGGPVTPVQDLLDWQPAQGLVADTVTSNGRTTVTVDKDAGNAVVKGQQQLTVSAGIRGRITHVLMDAHRAVVVIEDGSAGRGDIARLIDLDTGGEARLDQNSSPPTTTGGTWAMGQDLLVHATVDDTGAYCLATVSLESGQGDTPWCSAPRHGFRGAVVSDAGLSIMSFDDQRPASCATLLTIDGADATPFDGVTDCQGWDAARLDDGAVWSEVPKPNRQEHAVLHARVGDATYDLGPGTTGSLVWCSGAAYFVRDPQADTDPARLMRFTDDGTLAVVYESASQGNAFLSVPRCGGDAITLTSYGDQGDEQVSADLR